MKQRHPRVSPEGYGYIAICILGTILFALVGWAIIGVIFFILTILVINFFRDPQRIAPTDEDISVSPADGKIIKIDRVPDPQTGEERQRISIFMNVFDVHVNRSPVAGEIQNITYTPGRFAMAHLNEAPKFNERLALNIVSKGGDSWTVVQIAGLVARRIVSFVELMDRVSKGERIGLIKFGSRVDVYIPDNYDPAVTMGQKVLAGVTPLAKKRDTERTAAEDIAKA